MAKKPKPDATRELLKSIGEKVPKEKKQPEENLFRIFEDSKIPVSKKLGAAWLNRRDAALVAYESVRLAWDEAYRYYNHNQTKEKHETTRGVFRRGDSTENIVYANVATMIPAIYMKNPTVTFSTNQEEDEDSTKLLERAVNSVINKKTAPGINLKPRMKKATLHAELTNFGILKLELILKDNSREAAIEQMAELQEKWANAKNIKKIREIEGELLALEGSMEHLDPSGFKLTNIISHNLLVDPNAENEDGSDASWMMERTFIATDFLNARFSKADEDGDGRTLVFEPTHKIKTSGTGDREDALGPVLEAIKQGVNKDSASVDEQILAYRYENMTECWYVWDKSTRRILLYLDSDWLWPIWVWDDPFKLSRFFPYFITQFSPSTGGVVSPGETSYYLDQQDELNAINKEIGRIRRSVFNILVYNKNAVKVDEAKKIVDMLNNPELAQAIGVDVPEDKKPHEAVGTLTPPSVDFTALFNKDNLYGIIDRLSANSDALRGVQFKTNTTNDAVEAATSATRIRIGVKQDALEDVVADIAWSIAELLSAHADPILLSSLLSEADVQKWNPKTIQDLNATTNMTVVAGSVEKASSVFKKKEAVQLAQALGQFAQAAPGATLKVILKLFQEAFTEIVMTEEDWEALTDEIQQNLTRGVSTSKTEVDVRDMPPDQQRMAVQGIQRGNDPRQSLRNAIGAQRR